MNELQAAVNQAFAELQAAEGKVEHIQRLNVSPEEIIMVLADCLKAYRAYTSALLALLASYPPQEE